MGQLFSKLIVFKEVCSSLYIELQEFGVFWRVLCDMEVFSARIPYLEEGHEYVMKCSEMEQVSDR